VAYSFGEDDILASMLSTSRGRLEQFIKENLASQRGMVSVEVGHINRSKRVAPTEMWRKYRKSRYISKPTAEFEEYDFLEYTTLPGASMREPETSSFW
jgi:Tfp pilus assembly protein PilN